MMQPIGPETTDDRAIFCSRAWKPSDSSSNGWWRTNLICKDSQRCSYGMFLCYGVTSLLFALMNEGHRIGERAALRDPVRAMREISLDPWVKTKVLMVDGRQLTAVEIQRLYLDEAKSLINKGSGPEWAAEVVEHSCHVGSAGKGPHGFGRLSGCLHETGYLPT